MQDIDAGTDILQGEEGIGLPYGLAVFRTHRLGRHCKANVPHSLHCTLPHTATVRRSLRQGAAILQGRGGHRRAARPGALLQRPSLGRGRAQCLPLHGRHLQVPLQDTQVALHDTPGPTASHQSHHATMMLLAEQAARQQLNHWQVPLRQPHSRVA